MVKNNDYRSKLQEKVAGSLNAQFVSIGCGQRRGITVDKAGKPALDFVCKQVGQSAEVTD